MNISKSRAVWVLAAARISSRSSRSASDDREGSGVFCADPSEFGTRRDAAIGDVELDMMTNASSSGTKIMADEDNTKKKPSPEEFLEKYQEALDQGNPVMTFPIDHPLKIFLGPNGELAIDCAPIVASNNVAAVVRFLVAPGAIDKILQGLEEAKKIRDAQGEGSSAPTSH